MNDHPLNTPPIRLTIEQPLDLASSLDSGQAHRWRKDAQPGSEVRGGWHWSIIKGNLIKIRPFQCDSVGNASGVEFYSAPPSDSEHLKYLLRSYFRLDDDIQAIYSEITRDPRIATMVRRHRGLRLLRLEPWECLIAFICSANSNIPRIHANLEAISQKFGHPLTLGDHTRYTFPTPERLAEAGEATLRDLGLGFRAPYVARGCRFGG